MNYRILQSEIKSTEYGRVADLTVQDVENQTSQGSVWEKQKDGTLFPNFDKLVVGATFEANAWVSPKTGKTSFFPPKTAVNAKSRMSGAISTAMARKSESISKSMDRKEEAILLSSTIRDSVLIATTMASYQKYGEQEMKDKIMYWREWLVKQWNETGLE